MEWALTDFYILDSAMGTELAYRGYDLPDWKESIWSAKALNDGQNLIRSIHCLLYTSPSPRDVP